MLYQKEKEELKLLLKSGYPLIYVVAADERPVIHTLQQIIEELEEERVYELRTWDQKDFLYNEKKGNKIVFEKNKEGDSLPLKKIDVLNNVLSNKKNIVTVLHDFHLCYDLKTETDRAIVRALKNIAYKASIPFTNDYTLKKYKKPTDKLYKHTIITAPILSIPKVLEKLVYVVEFGLPGKKEVEDILHSIQKETTLELEEKETSMITNSLLGLTETEIFYSIKKSMERSGNRLNPAELLNEKKQILKKNKLVEYVDSDVQVTDVGGMRNLLSWVKKRKLVFDDTFRETYNLDVPKGLLLTGVQGCGKSFAVKAIANDLGLPLLKLDIGSLMSKWVGESDQNLRQVIELVETISPCVLWIDELEKSMPNSQTTSHETTQRMFGGMLTWLQEKNSLVFVVATSNNIQHLPPELLRKGRFDEIFFVDLPSAKERSEILGIHLKKKRVDVNAFNLSYLSDQCEGFSGAEIEVAINEAVLESALNGEKLNDQYIRDECRKTNPISETMKDEITEIREWAMKKNVRQVSDEPTYQGKHIGFRTD